METNLESSCGGSPPDKPDDGKKYFLGNRFDGKEEYQPSNIDQKWKGEYLPVPSNLLDGDRKEEYCTKFSIK